MSDTLTIFYERKLSDGSYGSEGLSMGYTISLHDDEPAEEMLNDGQTRLMFNTLKNMVLSYLADSEAPRVAAVAAAELDGKTTPSRPVRVVPDDDEDTEGLPF